MNTPDFSRPLILGTRGSDLALWQAGYVRQLLRQRWGDALSVEIEVIRTKGDKIQDRPLHEVGGKGLFVKEIEARLLDGSVDLAVHSMKDMPANMPPGLAIACTPEREDPRDALVGKAGVEDLVLAKLPAGTRLGTGSLRRAALVRRLNPKVTIVPIRGNVPTRVGLVDEGEVDCVLLAAAGLRRLGMADRISEAIDVERFCPSPCQGILGLQCRGDDERTKSLVSPMTHMETAYAAKAERAFLITLQAGCTVPMGCYAEVRAPDVMTVAGVIVDPTGRPCFMANKVGHPKDAAKLGKDLAETLLRLGAGRILEASEAA